jgi:hypothetical protein
MITDELLQVTKEQLMSDRRLKGTTKVCKHVDLLYESSIYGY